MSLTILKKIAHILLYLHNILVVTVPFVERVSFLAGQDNDSAGKISQSGRPMSSLSTNIHCWWHAVSLISLHWLEVGWMATPDTPHNPNRCRHKKGTALLKHSALAPRDVSPLISCVAVSSSFLSTEIYSSGPGEQWEDLRMLENSVRQTWLVVV